MGYHYQLDLLDEGGRSLERSLVSPDWSAALAWVHFEGIRAGRLPAVTQRGPSSVEPIWDARKGEPLVSGFRAAVRADDGGEMTREIPRIYLRGFAQDVCAGLVKKGVLKTGDVYKWTLSAFPSVADAAAAAAADDDFALEEVARPLPLGCASLAAYLARSVFAAGEGEEDAAANHVPVFLPPAILDETVELARQAGDVETGGVLVGLLHRDDGSAGSDTPELFVEVTAQIPAQHTVSASAKLTFTGETWAAVRAAIALRRRDELMLGWWHFHPDFCRLRNCPPERRRVCDGASPFFSADDAHLQATCFPAGYQIALLISESSRSDDLARSLFGWSQGMVVARGFHILGGTTNATTDTPNE
jgi:hypothetical protein